MTRTLADRVRTIKLAFPRDNRWDDIEEIAVKIEAAIALIEEEDKPEAALRVLKEGYAP